MGVTRPHARLMPLAALALLIVIVGSALAYAKPPAQTSAASAVPTTTSLPMLPGVGIAAGADLGFRSPSDRARELDDYLSLGVVWIRHDFAWDVAEPEPGVFNWAPYDAVVDGARKRGLEVIVTLSYTPAWANGGHADHRFAPQRPRDFGEFAAAAVRRYAPLGVHAYEIWNEPNIGFWQPAPNPVAYTAVLRAAYTAIHKVDPGAVVITGGMSPAGDGPSTYSPHTWLRALYSQGAKPYFDAIGAHPYVDADAGADSSDPGNPWYQLAGSTPSIRSIQADHGDSAKRIWATEVGCRREVAGCDGERLTRALSLWHSYPWAGVLCWFTYWDPNEYGLVDGSWIRRPEWFALRDAATLYR